PESRKWFWIGAGALAGAAFTRWQLARWFTPQPSYELERRIGELEIRVYGARWVAETTVSDVSWDQALDEGFRRLARYIWGDNHPSPFQPHRLGKADPVQPALAAAPADVSDAGYAIPMPVPTVARLASQTETIAMTSPVNVSTHEDRSYTIAF